MDTATKVAFIGFLGTIFTGIIGAIVAWFTNRKEKRQTVIATLEKIFDQRLILKEEIIAELEKDKVQLKLDLEESEAEVDRLTLAQNEQRAEEREHLDGQHK